MVLILFSGGIDSAVLAAKAHRGGVLGALLFVDYGQPAAEQESTASRWFADHYRVPLYRVNHRLHGVDSAMGTGEKQAGPRILPGRNLWLLATGLNIAASEGFTEVWYGATAADKVYPDCSPWFTAMVSAIALKDVSVRVEAPLNHVDKAGVVAAARRLDVRTDKTWSCYQPVEGKPCEECNSCKELAAAVQILHRGKNSVPS